MAIVEKRDLRIYVLSGCFLFGLFAGFIAYSSSQSAAARLEKERQQQAIIDQERREKQTIEQTKKTDDTAVNFVAPSSEKEVSISADTIAPVRLDEEIELVKIADWKTPPENGKVALDPRAGLNVFTAAPPSSPENINPRELLSRWNNSTTLSESRQLSSTPQLGRRPISPADDMPLPDLE